MGKNTQKQNLHFFKMNNGILKNGKSESLVYQLAITTHSS